MKKTAIILLSLLLLSVVAAQETPNEQVKVNLQDIEYKQLLIQQQAKIQLDIRNELDKRDAEQEEMIRQYVDENFEVLDKRIGDFITKATFKLGMVFLSATVLGGSILMLINRRINRKRAIKRKLEGTGESLYLSGQTLERIKEEQEEVEIPSPTKEKPKKVTAEAIRKKDYKSTYDESFKPKGYADMTIKPMGDKA